jgi:hypothetical protein
MKRIAGIALVLLGATLAVPEAGATCVTPNPNGKPSVAGVRTRSAGDVPRPGRGRLESRLQQWHSDGTELSVDNAVPPSLGNVCIGVYKQTGPRSYTLRHVTWNWTFDGHLAGTFLLITVD